jgi:hypothetical protein
VKNRRQLLPFAVVWITLFALVAPAAAVQYDAGLPPGILNVEVDGQPIDAVTVPLTGNASPEISGRVDLGLSVIDLAVADGEVNRFQAEVDNRGRFQAAVPQALPDGQYTLYINDVLIGAFTVQAGAETGADREPGPLLDIARVVPYPADFGDLVPGIGFLDGRFFTLEEEARRTAAAADGGSPGDVREVQRRLAEAGWLQRYESRLATPHPDNPDTFGIQFSSFVVEYASGADARAAYAALVEGETVVEAPVVGDESALSLLTGVTPDTGVEYQAARLIYRIGPMLGMIVYADLQNQQPDLALLDSVAQSVAARGVVIADRQTVPLGSMTLRLDPSPATGSLVRRDLYDVRAGTLTALFAEDEDTRESRIALFTGTTDSFSSTTNGTFALGNRNQDAAETEPAESAAPTPTSVIAIEGEVAEQVEVATPAATTAVEEMAPTAAVLMTSALYEFPGTGEADTWLAEQRERLVGQAGDDGTFTEVSEAPSFGEASATFATRRAVGEGGQTAGGYRMYARVGPIVAVIEIGSVPDVSLEAATELMQAQIACVEAGGCAGLASLPRSLAGGQRDRAIEEAPAEGASGADAEPTPGSVIIIEGEETAGESTREPRATREPRERRRNRQQTPEAPAG